MATDYATLKKGGWMRQKQKNNFSLRVRVVGGNLTATQLAKIAEVADKYVRAAAGEFGLNPIIDNIRSIEASKFKSVVFEDFDEQYMYFFGIALLFFILEMIVGQRRNRRQLFRQEESL